MKKNAKKLQLSRETLNTLTTEQNKLAAGGLEREPRIPATSDSVRICCA